LIPNFQNKLINLEESFEKFNLNTTKDIANIEELLKYNQEMLDKTLNLRNESLITSHNNMHEYIKEKLENNSTRTIDQLSFMIKTELNPISDKLDNQNTLINTINNQSVAIAKNQQNTVEQLNQTDTQINNLLKFTDTFNQQFDTIINHNSKHSSTTDDISKMLNKFESKT